MFVRALSITAVVSSTALMFIGCASKPPGLAHGREIYETCVPCHGSGGQGNHTLGAPAIAGLPQWYVEAQLTKFKTGVRGAHPDDQEGARMRPMARTLWKEGDIPSVAEYVSKMTAVTAAATIQGGDPNVGRQRYTSVCIACHGPDGKGLEALKAPTLTHQADWYMISQLNKFKSGMRGAHPSDITGSQMRAMAMTLPDSQAVRDVVAYIRTLAK